MTRVIQKSFIVFKSSLFRATNAVLDPARSRPGATFLTSVTSRTSAAYESNERRPEILGFHSREKAEIKKGILLIQKV